MSVPRRVGRKPGPQPTLTRDDVARAALAEGVGAMSMPSVARRLGVSHSTLYRYVHDRDDLVLAALDLAVREFDWPSADLGWRELLHAFADALWRFLEGHPGMAEAIQSAPGLPARVTELARTYGAKLRADGIGTRDAAVAIDFVADLTIATEIAMRGLGRAFDTPRGRRSLRELYQESWAALLADEPDVIDESTVHGRGWLTDKLTLLLDGLAGRVGAPAPRIAPPPTAAPVPLDRAATVAAGRELARREGLGAVTVRSVAELLSATPPALRTVIGDRDGLVVAMLDAVAEEIDVPPPAADPRADLVALALAMHAVLRADPWAVTALAEDGLASPLILPVLERVFTAFRAAGVPDAEIAFAARVLWDHVFGAALATDDPGSFSTRLARSADSPTITAVVDAARPRSDRTRAGVEALVEGLLRLHVAAPRV